MEVQHIDVMGLTRGYDVHERHACPLPRPLRHLACARMVHQDATHHLCRDAVELGAILPDDAVQLNQSKVGLVNERGLCSVCPTPSPGGAVRRTPPTSTGRARRGFRTPMPFDRDYKLILQIGDDVIGHQEGARHGRRRGG
jgi:hypothetical protein